MTDTMRLTPEERLALWAGRKQRIATCRECLERWPSRVEQTLSADEVPDPDAAAADRERSAAYRIAL